MPLHVSESPVAGSVVQSARPIGRGCVFRSAASGSPRSQPQQATDPRIARGNIPRSGKYASVSRIEQHLPVERKSATSPLIGERDERAGRKT